MCDSCWNRTAKSAIRAEIALLLTNQIAGNAIDFKMNIINWEIFIPVRDFSKRASLLAHILGPVYMRPGRCQTGMKIEIVNMFTWDRYENHISFDLFPCLPLLFFTAICRACDLPKQRAQLRTVWNLFVFTFIPLWIRPGLKIVSSVQRAGWLQTGLSIFY